MGYTLELQNVTYKDSGIYICEGTLNSNGEAFRAQSELLVGGKLQKNSYSEYNIYIFHFLDVTFYCICFKSYVKGVVYPFLC